MEKYPVFIDGKECGSLSAYTEGLMTKLEAECCHSEKLVRLYIFGSGKSAYLGVMQPDNGKLRLTKKLSRAQMRKFPEKIEYASDKPMEEKEEPVQPKTDDLLWFSTPQGILTCINGNQRLIAMPADMRASRYTKRIIRIINGREYVVFPGKRNLHC